MAVLSESGLEQSAHVVSGSLRVQRKRVATAYTCKFGNLVTEGGAGLCYATDCALPSRRTFATSTPCHRLPLLCTHCCLRERPFDQHVFV